MNQQKLFDYMLQEHGVTLLIGDMFEIEAIVLEPEPKQIELTKTEKEHCDWNNHIDEFRIHSII